MKYLWEFFEDLDEIVYVSDIETNDLIYMNAHLRKALGCHSKIDYIGKKCYEVLQGRDTPCSFCNNCKLEPEKFISWTHKNPVLDKTLLIKDTLIMREDKKYRLEMAIDIDSDSLTTSPYYYARNETVLNECLQQLFSTMNPEESIENVLAYIGKTFLCDRCYLFEFKDENRMFNTYEWCAKDITPQKEILQDEPLDSIDWWIQRFLKNQTVVIEDLEDIRTKHSSTYAILKPQNICTLVVGPIATEEKVLGFIGVDNPDKEMLPMITPLLNIIGYFFISLLHRRNILRRLSNLSFHDSLTGAFNRNAMAEHEAKRAKMRSVGVFYCDITGLKRVNDSLGHDAGDEMICQCYDLIKKGLDTPWIYRTGGDEFVVVCADYSHSDFIRLAEQFHNQIEHSVHHIAIGYAWSDEIPVNLDSLISQADKIMYQDKRSYYAKNCLVPGRDRRTSVPLPRSPEEQSKSIFYQFISSTYHDFESLFQSMSQNNASSYFYFGDLQKNMFYISDNLRSEFGFESNIVHGLLLEWAKRISTTAFRDRYLAEMEKIIQEKRTVFSLRYQVRNTAGKNMWVNGYGILKWNDDKTVPLFFSGRITHQDNEFVIDPVTGFPRASAISSRLTELEENGQETVIIGFSLNNIAEINNTRGRPYANRLLKNIADQLMDKFSEYISFYRLEGMRCLGLVDTSFTGNGRMLIRQIRDIIENNYHEMGISIHRACSFCLISFPYPSFSADNFQEHVISLIKMAKHDVSRPYVDYSTSSIQRIKHMSKLQLALQQDVLRGMEHFRIMIQPVVDAITGKILGGEVLLRWNFEGHDIAPSIFIPLLEQNNMIHLAGRWVFEQAARNCVRLISYVPDFYLSFNVSLLQLSDVEFTDIMQNVLHKCHLKGHHLIAEVTESCLDERPEDLKCFVERCSEMGMRIALDDFGSGYSSLRMLLHYPCSIIKLDRSLLDEMTACDRKWEFIRSIVYACHQFGKKVCMEGVETIEQNTIIQNAGCDMIQGFYHYRPLELSDLYKVLSAL